MKRKISQSGKVDNNGKLKMFMGEVNQFLSQNKGKMIIATFEVYEPNTSEALKGYYRNYVLPTVQKALAATGNRLPLKFVDTFLMGLSPVITDDMLQEGYEKMSQSDLSEYIDWLKQYAAENLNVYIEDPCEL